MTAAASGVIRAATALAVLLVLIAAATRITEREPRHDSNAAAASAAAPPVIRLDTQQDIDSARTRLITLLWDETALPATLPAAVRPADDDPRVRSLRGVYRAERLTIAMDGGLVSYAYHLIPRQPNGRVVLFHNGHDQSWVDAAPYMGALLHRGYSVMMFDMPLEGDNRDSARARATGDTVRLTAHADFERLRPAHGHALRYFVEPVVVGLNHLQQAHAYTDIAMLGLSGGGWTTTLAAAIDPRIRLSFPVAGSLPRYLRLTEPDRGDWEQQVPALYDATGYLELYVLGAYGPGRRQVQILNVFDPCCFGGTLFRTYEPVVSATLHRLGAGEFSVFGDDSHRTHAISDAGLRRVIAELDGCSSVDRPRPAC